MGIGTVVAGVLIAFLIIVVIGFIIVAAVASSIDVKPVKVKLTEYDGDEPGSFCAKYPIDVQCM